MQGLFRSQDVNQKSTLGARDGEMNRVSDVKVYLCECDHSYFTEDFLNRSNTGAMPGFTHSTWLLFYHDLFIQAY